jgi:3-deoxy-D-manno-octulosonic-acid transferase
MLRLTYSLLMYALVPLLRMRLLWRSRMEPGYQIKVAERFGHYSSPLPGPLADSLTAVPPVTPLIWIHAVSLGETRVASVLIERLRRDLPGMRLLLTHGTATGRREGERLLRAGDLQVWQPWDTPGAVWRFLLHFKPTLGVLMETEVWPNLVAACAAAGVPLALANARMSEKSLRKARRLAWLSGPAFRGLRAVWAQTEADASRLRSLGAPVQGVFGNLKFDASPDASQLALGRAWRSRLERPVLMLASAREGEEAALLGQLRALGQGAGAVQWLIVPRHPQRFDEVAALIADHGFSVSRRSDWGDGPSRPTPGAGATIWLGDSMGEMALYYGLSDAALLGGSFAPLGGQNLIEAAACACPVLMGPHTFNFAEAASLALQAGAALRSADMQQALAQALQLALDDMRLMQMREAAVAFSESHRGATARTAQAAQALIA